MENRFKVRAWLIKEKKMTTVVSIDYKNEKIQYLCDNLVTIKTASLEDIVLMQCTGLLATSSYRGESDEDRLIYEGDVVHTRGDAVLVVYVDGYDQLDFDRITHGCGFVVSECSIEGDRFAHKALLEERFWEYVRHDSSTDENVKKCSKKVVE